MDFIYIGKIVNTHGIKGEVRILSDFKYKSEVFLSNKVLYVGDTKERLVIKSYRRHKDFDQVIFDGIMDINDVLKYKGECVYINRDDFTFSGILNEDIIGLGVYSDDVCIGRVTDILNNGVYDILVVDDKYMIPNVCEFVSSISVDDGKILVQLIEGLIDEN